LIKGKLPADDVLLSSLSLSPGHTFMLMGTIDSDLLIANDESEDNVVDDFDYDTGDMASILKDIENKTRLQATIKKTAIGLIHPLRTPAKKLCVFDLDYTLFDCKRYLSSLINASSSQAGHISQLARPGMHELLTSVYKHYEIVVWSQTSWKWLEVFTLLIL
jgi:ubiquitin-like domain-containing CTD phosphatase 1